MDRQADHVLGREFRMGERLVRSEEISISLLRVDRPVIIDGRRNFFAFQSLQKSGAVAHKERKDVKRMVLLRGQGQHVRIAFEPFHPCGRGLFS